MPPPHIHPREIEAGIRSLLPEELQSRSSTFAFLIAQIVNENIARNNIKKEITIEPEIEQVAQALRNQRVNSKSGLLVFGEESQLGDFTLRDIAGNDILNVNFHFNTLNKRYQLSSTLSILVGLLILTVIFVLLFLKTNPITGNTSISATNTLNPSNQAGGQTELLPPGIYISKIVNPGFSETSPTTTTVWLTSGGTSTYIVDSIRIGHFSGNCMSMGSGAVPPDADYRFSFGQDSDQTHALNPALSLSPTDRREVSFVLGLAPEGTFSTVCGHVTVRIFYHTNTGETGTLLISEPSKGGQIISHLTGSYVKVFNSHRSFFLEEPSAIQIIAPNGMQIGDNGSLSTIEYSPLLFPEFSFYELNTLPLKAPQVDDIDKRMEINNLIMQLGKLPDILKMISIGDETAIDICAGLLVQECTQSLTEASKNDDYIQMIGDALAIRHMINPDESLAKFILNDPERIRRLFACQETRISANVTGRDCSRQDVLVRIVYALMIHPKGKWDDALSAIATFDGLPSYYACDALKLRNKLGDGSLCG